jgi:hypothetical protein
MLNFIQQFSFKFAPESKIQRNNINTERPSIFKIICIAAAFFSKTSAQGISRDSPYFELMQEPPALAEEGVDYSMVSIHAGVPWTMKDTSQLIKAIGSGSLSGVKDWIEVFKHPLDTIVYPITTLVSDTAVMVTFERDSKLYLAASENMEMRHKLLEMFDKNFLTGNAFENAEELARFIVNAAPGLSLGKAITSAGKAMSAGAAKVNRVINKYDLPFVDNLRLDTRSSTYMVKQLPQGVLKYSYTKGAKKTYSFFVEWLENTKEFRGKVKDSGSIINAWKEIKKVSAQLGAHRVFLQLDPANERLFSLLHNKFAFMGEYPRPLHFAGRFGYSSKTFPVFEIAKEARGLTAPSLSIKSPLLGLGISPILLETSKNGSFSQASDEDSYFFNNAHCSDDVEPRYDMQKVNEIKSIIEEAEQASFEEKSEALKKVEKITASLSSAEILKAKLSQKESAFLDAMYNRAQAQMGKTLSQIVGDFVDNANVVFDKRAFAQRAYKERMFGADTLSGELSTLHTLANIFTVFEPKKAALIKSTIQFSTNIIEGGSGMMDVFSTMGIAALTDSLFSVASGNFLSGITGLIGLFGEKHNPNEELLYAMQAISDQIMCMHRDLLEGIRHISISLNLMSEQMALGFESLEMLVKQHHNQQITLLENMQKFLYIDRVYLEKILDDVRQLKVDHYVEKIDSSDWSKAISKVTIHCKVYKKSLSLDLLREDLLHLVETLKEVQKNSLARSRVDITDANELFDRLSAFSHFIGGDRGNQNIHLFHAYLVKKFKGMHCIHDLPSADSLHNQAALDALLTTAQELVRTYTNRNGYLGLPSDVQEILDVFVKGVAAHKKFVAIVTSPEVIKELLTDYQMTSTDFTKLLKEYLDHAMFRYHQEHGVKKNTQQMIVYKAMLETAQKLKSHVKMDGPNWFTTLGWWFVQHFRQARPAYNTDHGLVPTTPHWERGHDHLFVATEEMNLAKARYTALYEKNVLNLNAYLAGDLLTHQTVYRTAHSYDKLIDFHNSTFNLFHLSESSADCGLERRHYFINEQGFPLPVTKQHLSHIPAAIRLAHELGLGELLFKWQLSDKNDEVLLKANWCYEIHEEMHCIVLFEQKTGQLHGYPHANPLESVYYTWLGGEPPTGGCASYDSKLAKHSTSADLEAIKTYTAPQPSNYIFHPQFTHYELNYRPLICYPNTKGVKGLFYHDGGVLKVDESIFNSWPITPAIPSVLSTIQASIQISLMGVRQKIMHDAASLLRTGRSKSLSQETFSSEINEQMMEKYTALSVKAIIAKIALAFADTAWLNLFDGNDLLREMHNYKGQRVHLLHLLERNAQAFPELIAQLTTVLTQNKGATFKREQELEKFVQEVEKDIVPDILAETQCKGIIECENLFNSKTFRHLFQQLPIHIKEKYPYQANP